MKRQRAGGPVPGSHRIYRDVLPEYRERLSSFRATHPYERHIANGVTWEYIACGQGAEAVLLLGGALSVGESAFDRILALEGAYRVISPSYPPVGTMTRVTDGLAAVLDAEGIERAHVFGHSLGAAVAHTLVRRHPDRVDKLVLSSFGLYERRSARMGKLVFALLGLLPRGAIRALYLPRIRRALSAVGEDERAFLLAYFDELFSVLHTRETLVAGFKLLADLIDRADEYRVFEPVERPGRVLIIAAEDDTGFKPSEREGLKATYPGADVCVFDRGGHWVGLVRREEYNAVLIGFLRRDGGA